MKYQHSQCYLVEIKFKSNLKTNNWIGSTGIQHLIKEDYPYATVKVKRLKQVENIEKVFHLQGGSSVIEY